MHCRGNSPDAVRNAARALLDECVPEWRSQRILAAVSGGPDSVCLLDVLAELTDRLEAAHFDHQTRDGQSAEDAAFVEAMAGRLGLPFHLERRAVEAEADASPLSFEEYAREARYAFLLRVAKERDCGLVVTGHNADDQAETLLMRLLRGTAPSGLAGIPGARREGHTAIVRPLLHVSRADIEAYLDEQGLDYRTDASNRDILFTRNRVRHELLPFLEQCYNPRVRHALLRLADLARAEDGYVAAAADAFTEACRLPDSAIDRPQFRGGHPALQRRAILRMAWEQGVDCPAERVLEAVNFIEDADTGKCFDVGAGLTLRCTRDRCEWVREAHDAVHEQTLLDVPGEADAFGRHFSVRLVEGPPPRSIAECCSPARQFLDADAVGPRLTIRAREPGDRFRPLGLGGTKKLKDYYREIGLPPHERDAHPLVVGARGIVWVTGHAIDESAAITETTAHCVEIEVTDAVE